MIAQSLGREPILAIFGSQLGAGRTLCASPIAIPSERTLRNVQDTRFQFTTIGDDPPDALAIY